ncbi:MAG: protein kinase [Micromonosporaceae bacterium]|nr:protein kinase [Micromonosporaceae bacterium]
MTPLHGDDPVTVGPYRTLGRLGSGGMGTVYLAIAAGGSLPAGPLVAAKVVHRQLAHDEHFRARFRTEAQLASRVASFSTAPVLDYGEADGQPYLITEYIEGTPLDQMVRRKGALSESAVHGVAVSIAAALTSIHSAGLVHRDLKPGNVVLSLSGARVIDFGIARALDTPSSLTRSGVTMGSPGWMAPEQILGKPLTSAADVFAWGCLVSYAATARHPFGGGDPVSVAYRTLHDEPNLDGVPESLRPTIARALATRPEQRPTAYELLTRLSGSTAARPASPHPEPGDPTPARELITPERASAATRAVAHTVADSGAARARTTRGARRAGRRRHWWTLLGCAVLLSLTALLAIGAAYPSGPKESPRDAPRAPADNPERNQGRSDPLHPDPTGSGQSPSDSAHEPDASPSAPPSQRAPGAPASAAPSATPSRPGTPSASPSDAEPPPPTPTEPAG